jgi:hypothetical protein
MRPSSASVTVIRLRRTPPIGFTNSRNRRRFLAMAQTVFPYLLVVPEDWGATAA